MRKIICPISPNRIDGNVSRITVFMNCALLVAYVFTSAPAFVIAVAVDYAFRAFNFGKFSPIRFVAAGVARALNLKPALINEAPKVFAARLGFLCAFASSILALLGFGTAALAVAGLFAVLAFLDSVCNFCVGCVLYTYVVLPLYSEN